MQEYEQAVFISYAWGGASEELVNQMDEALAQRGLTIIRDKRDLGYKGSISAFMERIGQGSCIIVVISDKYLRSPNCMFELVEIAEGKQFHDRVFPIVLSNAEIYDPVKRLGYVKHWEDKLAELDQAMKEVSQANLQGIREEIDQYSRIRDKISGLTSILKDMNTLTPDMHRDSDFSEIYVGIEKRMAGASGEIKPESGESPYMGLRYFDTSDADLFFGRDALTHELTERVSKESFLAIVGASGSGKSSVARAGLIPVWKKENEKGVVHVITPTAHPLESLAASLTRDSESVTATSTLMDDMGKDSRSLRLYARKLLSNSESTNLLLVVDQFEETFTLCKDLDERKAFIENLLSLADEDNNSARVAITLRADFYHHCAEYEGLRLTLEKHQAYIGAMTQDELREAILQPAETNGWDFQPGLVDLILQDVGTEPGALPLLSHALLETWKRRQGRTLTLQGYHEAGGVRKAITHTAESVYDKLSPTEQTIARNIFLRLTELGEGVQDTRRRVKMDELAQAQTTEHDAIAKVLKTLTDARLVTTEQDSAEVAHEALIREWGTLRKWLDEDRESLRLHRNIIESASEWERSDRSDLFLVHRGGRLDDALSLKGNSFFGLSSIQEEYLLACSEFRNKEQSEHERRLRLIMIASIVTSAIFLGLVFLAFTQRNAANYLAMSAATAQTDAENQKATAITSEQKAIKQSQIAIARQLSSQAQFLNNTFDFQLIATLLDIQSMKLFPNGDAANFLLNNKAATSTSFMAHDDSVSSVAFSPNGKYVASGSDDYTARVWEASSGKEVSRMTHDSSVLSVAFSPDGKYVISSSEDNTARVWEASSGQEISRMTHDDDVSPVAFSPDGKYAVSGSADYTARVWEVSSGKEVSRMTHEGWVISATFSPDGKYLVSGSTDHTARVWEVASGREISRMMHDDSVSSIAFSPDGKYVVSGSRDNTARVWEVFSGKEISRMTHNGYIKSVTFSPDGKYVASGSLDLTVLVWEASSGKEISSMTHASFGYVTSVAFSPDGKYIVSGSGDNTARVWETFSGQEVSRMTHDGSVLSVAFSPDGKYVTSSSEDKTVRVWKALREQGISHITHDSDVSSVAFSPNGKYVVSGSADHTARVWEVSSGKEVSRITHDNGVTSVAFSPDGNYVVSLSRDNASIVTIIVWHAINGKEISRMTHDDIVTSVKFSPNGEYIVSGSWDGTARVWEVVSGQEIVRTTYTSHVTSVDFSPDSKFVVAGSRDGTVRVWEVPSGKEIVHMTFASSVTSVDFSPDGNYVVTGSADHTARVWKAVSGQEITHLTHDDIVDFVAFSPDGKNVVSLSRDNTVRVWEAISGQEIIRISVEPTLSSIMFSPDGKYIIGDTWMIGTISVWDIASRQEIARLPYNYYLAAAFSPDGKYIVTGSADHIARVWEWHAEDLIASACEVMPRNLTQAEWEKYIGDVPHYQAVCENLPIEDEATSAP